MVGDSLEGLSSWHLPLGCILLQGMGFQTERLRSGPLRPPDPCLPPHGGLGVQVRGVALFAGLAV